MNIADRSKGNRDSIVYIEDVRDTKRNIICYVSCMCGFNLR